MSFTRVMTTGNRPNTQDDMENPLLAGLAGNGKDTVAAPWVSEEGFLNARDNLAFNLHPSVTAEKARDIAGLVQRIYEDRGVELTPVTEGNPGNISFKVKDIDKEGMYTRVFNIGLEIADAAERHAASAARGA